MPAPKKHKRLKKHTQKNQQTKQRKHLFNWIKQDKTCTFSRKSSCSSFVQHKNRKTNNSNYLVSVGCGRLAEGKGHDTPCSSSCRTNHELGPHDVTSLKYYFHLSCVFNGQLAWRSNGVSGKYMLTSEVRLKLTRSWGPFVGTSLVRFCEKMC